ncbi:RNA polymerase sigma-70 factor (sigma-E family) [Nocardioides thalensis]|uniref:RNA polymerase sigma-70 factor (Sigma-E family) n=1 Tax=Nocardioides thalensis TaxID=1914755 RepID=A0A853C8P0_9ACTN|nr:RNA polymerase sigma-70 factor (sigma-E family) [Nocardioides thalensis]
MIRDREASYVEFVTTRRDHLRRVAYALCGDWHRADDLVQTALVKLYVAWPRVRRTGSEEAYARTILVRASIDESRRPWRRERPTEAVPDAPAAAPLAAEERSALLDALHALPPQQRVAVVLRHWLGLSVAEAAKEMRISEGTVKSHTSRGLAALRSVLDPAGT